MPNDHAFSIELAQSLVSASEQFPVDFDELWQWCGYSRKDSAKERLERNFEVELDYIVHQGSPQMAESGTLKGSSPDVIVLTVDAAKHFAMLTQTEQGKEVRRYFIEAEKALRQLTPVHPQFNLPQNYEEALEHLLIAVKEKHRLELETQLQAQLLAEQKPKVEFYNDVIDLKDTIDMAQVAKVLNKGVGRNNLFAFLRKQKVLRSNNQPYQKYIDAGYFRCVEITYTQGDTTRIYVKTVVFQKGLDFIRELVNREYLDGDK